MDVWHRLKTFAQIVLSVAAADGVRYLLFAGVVWLACHVVLRSWWFRRKIVARYPCAGDYVREMLYSGSSLLVFGCVAAGTWLWSRSPGSPLRLYLSVADYRWNWFGLVDDRGWGWFLASIVAMIFVHDAYFYWTHRLMHHRRLFRLVHLAHHRSINPTPFAAFAFSPWEAAVQAGIFPLVALVMPVNVVAFGIFMLWQLTFNVLGHSGFEIFGEGHLGTRLGKFMNTPTHHVLHHQRFRANFGIYFNFWDRWMGTNDVQYASRFAEVAARAAAGATSTEASPGLQPGGIAAPARAIASPPPREHAAAGR